MVSIRLARVTFATRRAALHGGAQCDPCHRPARAGWMTNACGRSQMRRVASDCVTREQPAFETMHPHAGLIPAVCRLPFDPTDECQWTGKRPPTAGGLRKMDSQREYPGR